MTLLFIYIPAFRRKPISRVFFLVDRVTDYFTYISYKLINSITLEKHSCNMYLALFRCRGDIFTTCAIHFILQLNQLLGQ